MRLPFLLLLFFISLTCFNINAEEIILREPKIGNTDIKFSDFGGSATVITEQDIKASGATEIHQLLREVPGLSVKRAGARGGMIRIPKSVLTHRSHILLQMPFSNITGMSNRQRTADYASQ